MHTRRNRTLTTGLILLLACAALVFAGCNGKKKRNAKKPKKKPDYNQKWHDILEIGEKGQFEIKQGWQAVNKARTDAERDEGYETVVSGMKTILEAIDKADHFFEMMHKLFPSVATGGYEDQVAEWNQDYSHAKKQLPLKYGEKFN